MESKTSISEEQLYFLVFCIEQYKNHCSKNGEAIKTLFDKTGVTNYLISNYEVLHTQSAQWIIEDIDLFLKNHKEVPK